MQEQSSTPRRSLAVRLTSDPWEPSEEDEGAVDVARASELPRLLLHPPDESERLLVVGSPPRDEIGFGFIPMLALRARPRVVELLDVETGRRERAPLARFLARSATPAAAQLLASSGGVAAQAAAALMLRARRRSTPVSGGVLRRVVYVRSGAGSSTTVGGAATHTHEVIRALGDVGVTVQPITNDARIAASAAREPDPPCTWRVVSEGRLLRATPPSAVLAADLAVARAALPSVRAADVVYQRHGRFSLVGAILAALTGKPLFLEHNGSELYFHEHWQPGPFARQLAWCEEAALAMATRIVVVSDVARRDLIAQGIEDERIVLNPNGVDASRFARGDGPELRARLGVGDAEVLIGFVGSFGPWHGAPALAEAFAKALREAPELRLLMVGDGSEREATEDVLERHGARGRSIFTGSVPSREVPQYLDACDVVVAPHVPLPGGAEFFGSPTKLFEYMASGKAIAASSLGQIGEVLEDGVTAALVTPGDVEALAAALVHLARDPELRARLGAAARDAAIERHSWHDNARRIVAAYAALGTAA